MTDHMGDFKRDVFAARTRAAIRQETHVCVGDHTPEPRVRHEPRTRLDQCASHAPDRRDDYIVPASASHGPR